MRAADRTTFMAAAEVVVPAKRGMETTVPLLEMAVTGILAPSLERASTTEAGEADIEGVPRAKAAEADSAAEATMDMPVRMVLAAAAAAVSLAARACS